MSKCECTMAIRVNGDGCRYCQPQETIDRLLNELGEMSDELHEVSKERDDMEVLFHLWRSRLTWVISRVYITEKGGFFFGDGKPSEIDKKLALENIDKCAREEI